LARDQSSGGGLNDPPIALIAAVARNGIIGNRNALLWRLPSDLKRFRALTMGKPLIIGRKTWDSIGRPLPGRWIIVVTRQSGFAVDGVLSAESVETAIALGIKVARTTNANEVIIGGGGEIYRQSMTSAQRLYITEVALSPEGDTRFPTIDPVEWRETRREKIPRGERDEADSELVEYFRRD
jgi:dihydrofolate reductase